MIDRPLLAPRLRAYVLPGEAVVLLAATGDVTLTGAIYQRLVPRLDGSRTATQLATELARDVGMAETLYALGCLEQAGLLVDAVPNDEPRDVLTEDELRTLVAPRHVALVHDLLDAEPTAPAWLPVRCGADGVWIAPRLAPTNHRTCWECLVARLRLNRPAAALVHARGIAPLPLPRRRPRAPRWLPDALDALEADDACADAIVALDASGTIVARHPLPRCAHTDHPIAPTPPDDASAFVALHGALLDPLTGIGRGVRPLVVPNGDAIHVYVGGPNRARAARTTRAMRHDLREFAGGKGLSDVLARASLIGELAERYSACHRGDEPRTIASLTALGDRAIHPNDCMLFSERQLDTRAERRAPNDAVPERLDPDAPIAWSPVWSLTRGEWRQLPTAYLYLECVGVAGMRNVVADSNGNAAGGTREQAILHGLLELIERDAVGIWWHNASVRPAVALDDVDDPWLGALVAQLGRLGREMWILDVTTELGVPTYAAVSRCTDGAPERIALGFGAHVDGERALLRAAAELAQTIAVMHEIERRTGEPVVVHDTGPFLLPCGDAPRPSRSVAVCTVDAIDVCRRAIEAHAMECLVLDQARADVGVPTVKVVVPGLRHFPRRLAPGRLFDVPRRLGWLPYAMDERSVNPSVLAL